MAEIAGINGAKHTSSFIPICHSITLTHVRVEMEALIAIISAGLTVYDKCKAGGECTMEEILELG